MLRLRDVHRYLRLYKSFRDDVVPDFVNRFNIAAIAGDGCHICHAGIHINGTHGMSYGFILLYYGFVCLTVSVFPACVSTGIQEELCLIEILLSPVTM